MERMGYEQTVADIYAANNNYKESTAALKEAFRLCDSIRQIKNGYTDQELQAQYQTKFQQENNKLLEKHNKALTKELAAEERLLLMYLFASIAAVIVIVLYLRGYRLRNRLQKELLKNMEADKAFTEQQHLHEQELIASQKDTIQEKQREATSIALQLANYYDSLNQIIEKCNTPAHSASDIKKELLALVKQKDYWKQFETRFNDLNPEFASTLVHNYPRLTKNDIEFCSLLKLKLSYKEIASLLQISHESVITKKYRVRKKMELQDEIEFEKMLAEM
jgi:DNA-binding CsgD family transcriptional regulator